ncbi:hypothetical protein Q5752_005232 [Cryptotrichosporon argae]
MSHARAFAAALAHAALAGSVAEAKDACAAPSTGLALEAAAHPHAVRAVSVAPAVAGAKATSAAPRGAPAVPSPPACAPGPAAPRRLTRSELAARRALGAVILHALSKARAPASGNHEGTDERLVAVRYERRPRAGTARAWARHAERMTTVGEASRESASRVSVS